MRARWQWLLLLLVAVVLFYWKIAFTGQFSVLLGYEGANLAYAWYHFSASTIQQGALPIWDPYTHSDRSFARLRGHYTSAHFNFFVSYPKSVIAVGR